MTIKKMIPESYSSPLIDSLLAEITPEDQIRVENEMMDEILKYYLYDAQ